MTKTTKVQFIGDKEIVGIKNNEVIFKDWDSQTYTDKQLSYMVTDEPKDATAFADLVVDTIAEEVMKTIAESDTTDVVNTVAKILNTYESHDIMNRQVDTIGNKVMLKMRNIMETVVLSRNRAYEEAVWKAFWTYHEGLHSKFFVENIKFSDIARLKK